MEKSFKKFWQLGSGDEIARSENVPVSVSELSNDADYMTNGRFDEFLSGGFSELSSAATEGVDGKIEGLSGAFDGKIRDAVARRFEVVDALPDASAARRNCIYLAPAASLSAGDDSYDEWVVVGDDPPSWERLGSTRIDLSPYCLKAETSSASQIWDALSPVRRGYVADAGGNAISADGACVHGRNADSWVVTREGVDYYLSGDRLSAGMARPSNPQAGDVCINLYNEHDEYDSIWRIEISTWDGSAWYDDVVSISADADATELHDINIDAIWQKPVFVSGRLATEGWVGARGYLTEHQSLSAYYLKSETSSAWEISAYVQEAAVSAYAQACVSAGQQISPLEGRIAELENRVAELEISATALADGILS